MLPWSNAPGEVEESGHCPGPLRPSLPSRAEILLKANLDVYFIRGLLWASRPVALWVLPLLVSLLSK